MYIEFVISYILIGILAVLLAVVIALQCIIIKKMSRANKSTQKTVYNPYSKGTSYTGGNRGIAICKNCATQFDSSQSNCPRCGIPR